MPAIRPTARELLIATLAVLVALTITNMIRSAEAGGRGGPTTDVVYIATGLNFPDALGAAAAAGASLAPVLLVTQNSVPTPTLDELNRLMPEEIIIVGGTAVISDGVKSTLEGLSFAPTVTRIAGADRYATAAALSAAIFPTSGSGCSVEEHHGGLFRVSCGGSSATWRAESCELTPAPSNDETVFVVAYMDVVEDQFDYDPSADVLIAKLIDGPNGDGVPGTGDLVITHQYPKWFFDVSPVARGAFCITQHEVTSASFGGGSSDWCRMETANGAAFYWEVEWFGVYERYWEGTSVPQTELRDTRSGPDPDELVIDRDSPSRPTDALALLNTPDFAADEGFLDIEWLGCWP